MGFKDTLKGIGKQFSPAYQVYSDLKPGGGGGKAVAADLGKDAVTMGKMALMGGFLHGGKVKKKGPYMLHEGERVLNKKQTKKWEHDK